VAVLDAADRAALARIVGPDHVVVDPDRRAAAAVDWTGRVRGATPAVVRPATTEQVAAVLAHCHAAGLCVVPQGGNTGLAAGAVPHGELVVDLRRLDHIGPVDVLSRQVTAGAGVSIAALQATAAAHELRYAVDFAARDQATVGGSVATNAGGIHVLRWGGTRQQLVGIEAVLADGRVLSHLGGLEKDNTGYDLAGLLCGSEGTLAVVTAARLRLVPAEPDAAVALLGLESVADAVNVVSQLRADLPQLSAAELVLGDGIELVCRAFERPAPLSSPWPAVVLVEARGRGPQDELLASALDAAPIGESAVASDAAGCAALWSYREDQTLAINTLGPPHKLDVTLPLGELGAFSAEVPEVVAAVAPDASVWQFGHLGDGNLHVNVSGVDADDEMVDAAVLELVAQRGGSISAEHGIGQLKRRWLHLARSEAEIDAFRAIKAALDPRSVLNPRVLLPTDPDR
jgi:FAD/FMN-containing dehydrogenase